MMSSSLFTSTGTAAHLGEARHLGELLVAVLHGDVAELDDAVQALGRLGEHGRHLRARRTPLRVKRHRPVGAC